MSNIAIIPARRGSKRIPLKNIKSFLGKPIISYSINAALKSKLFDEIIVSTDNDEIAEIAIKFGAKVPFLRSKKNSNDFASTFDVLEEVLKKYDNEDKNYKYGCCIYPAAPLVSENLITKGYEKIMVNSWDTIFPVVEFLHPIERALCFDNQKKINFLSPKNSVKRTQDLKKYFHDSGQFYWFNIKKLLTNKCLISKNTSGFIVSSNEIQDIDNIDDWKLAELKYKLKYK